MTEKFDAACAARGRKDLAGCLVEVGDAFELRVKGNKASPLDDEGAKILAEAVADAGVELSAINAENQELCDAGVAALAVLGARTLNFRGNNISAAAGALARSGCEALDLSRNPLGRSGGLALAEALAEAGPLRLLCIAHADLDTAALVAVCASLLRSDAALEALDLSGNTSPATEQQDDVAKHVSSMLGLNAGLRTLKLAGMRFGNDAAGFLADALGNNRALTTLDLKSNKIRAAGAAALADVLADGRAAAPLLRLDLSHNRIGDAGAEALALALRVQGPLEELDVSHNLIYDRGLEALGHACLSGAALKFLGAWGNTFGKAANAAFFELDTGAHDAFVELDFAVFSADGRLTAAATK